MSAEKPLSSTTGFYRMIPTHEHACSYLFICDLNIILREMENISWYQSLTNKGVQGMAG